MAPNCGLTISRYYTPSGRSIQKPYEDEDDYSRDIISRYNHGEFFHSDSIKFNDTLKYLTLNGRTVYGGGGIMPDYFVPLDTSLNSHYLNELYTSTAIQEYTFEICRTEWRAIGKTWLRRIFRKIQSDGFHA
jgi:carboxyl-terminal processing protease